MTEEFDLGYETGQRMAWTRLLDECLRHLGYEHYPRERWLKEAQTQHLNHEPQTAWNSLSHNGL